MALPLKPHTIIIKTVSQGVTNNMVQAPAFASDRTVSGMIQPDKASTMFNVWGIEVKDPHLLFTDVEEATYLTVGSKVLLGSRVFSVAAPPRIWNAETATSHAETPLQELRLT